MSEMMQPNLRIPISEDFFCDGKFYVLTSTSLGGSELTTKELSTILGDGQPTQIEALLQQGICIPLFFEADCELDRETLFVIGDLTPEEANGWIGRLRAKLHIPCGKLVFLCGGGDAEELAKAISGQPPQPDYQIFQVIDLPAGDYLVEVYAYLSSAVVQNYLEQQEKTVEAWFMDHCPDVVGQGYIIRLSPLDAEPPLPRLVPEVGWCGEFEFRQPE